MIEGTLTLKRFADRAVAALFTRRSEVEDQADADMSTTEEGLKARLEDVLTVPERKRQIEMEDAIRVGLKAGMGSRQNAPAEWIGESDERSLLTLRSQTP